MKRFILLPLLSITAIQLSAQSKLLVKILADETGPHQNTRNSDLTDHKRNKGQEITDIFAGVMLYNLGSPLGETHSAINNVSEERESNIHTPGHARIESVTSRWQKVKDKSPMQFFVHQLHYQYVRWIAGPGICSCSEIQYPLFHNDQTTVQHLFGRVYKVQIFVANYNLDYSTK